MVLLYENLNTRTTNFYRGRPLMDHFVFSAPRSFLTWLLPWLFVSHVVFVHTYLELEFTLT